MRLSQFNSLIADEFGVAYSAVIRRDLVLGDLGDLTADKAIASGFDPKEVWLAVCHTAGVPKERWHGLNKHSKKDTPK
ncbi:unannotated protein [freshwater metagenome]|jgi:hypothetical protein|uniref:Unannotated protein n=1 Tax=freshwater metagenome TaxID=449393 RepID=A0A6J7K9N1_9ZZZZ|nr:DUF3046 domain-containing protein [Actinomycetota bacterium]